MLPFLIGFKNIYCQRGTCPCTCVRIYTDWTFKTLGGACLIQVIDNDNNYTNDVNSGLLNSLSVLDLLLYGKWRLRVINFLEACCCLATWCQIFPPLCFTGHWRKLHPIVSLDTIPASRSSKRLRELVSICMLRWNSGYNIVFFEFYFSVPV